MHLTISDSFFHEYVSYSQQNRLYIAYYIDIEYQLYGV